jgi:hypothetical protein
MSRLSQFIDYMNVEPSKLDKNYILFNYTDFTITKSMKKARRKHLRQKNKIK